MGICHKTRYTIGYETLWHSSTAGDTKTPGHRVVEIGQDICLRGGDGEFFHQFCRTLVPILSQEWAEGAPPHASPWPAPAIVEIAEAKAAAVVGEGPSGGRLPNKPVDAEAYRRVDKEAFRREIPSLPCLEANGGVRLELPEAGATGPGEG